jgi:hypothetical protein
MFCRTVAPRRQQSKNAEISLQGRHLTVNMTSNRKRLKFSNCCNSRQFSSYGATVNILADGLCRRIKFADQFHCDLETEVKVSLTKIGTSGVFNEALTM